MLPEKFKKPLYVCMREGFCRSQTYHEHGIEKICPIREFESPWDFRYARGKCTLAKALYDDDFELNEEVAEMFYMCTLCGNCREHCIAYYPYQMGWTEKPNLDTVEMFESIRAEIVKQGFGPMPQHKIYMKSITSYGNPYQQPTNARTRWIRKMGPDFKVKTLGNQKKR